MINDKGERVESPKLPEIPPHMLENPRSSAQEEAFGRVKESPEHQEQLANAEKVAEQREADEAAAAKEAPAKKRTAKKAAKKASAKKSASEAE